MRFVGRGHPSARATHDKTWELSPDPQITERATCIVSVGTRVEQPVRLAGPVRLTLTAAGMTWVVDAVANPAWDPAGPAVVRRSPVRTPGTFATEADGSAADIPRALAEQLADPSVEVILEVTPLPTSAPTVVLVALGPGADAVLAAEFAAADLVVAEDAAAGRLLGERVAAAPVTVQGRVVVAAVDDLPGRTVLDRPAGTRVETRGMPPSLAAAVALPAAGAVVLAPAGADARSALQRTPAGARVVVATTTDRVADLRRVADEVLGEHLAAVAWDDRPPLLLGADTDLPGRDAVRVAVVASTPRADPGASAMVRGLLADGVPTKAVARALAAVTGESQRSAYDTVLAVRDS